VTPYFYSIIIVLCLCNNDKARGSGELCEVVERVPYASQLCWCHARGVGKICNKDKL